MILIYLWIIITYLKILHQPIFKNLFLLIATQNLHMAQYYTHLIISIFYIHFFNMWTLYALIIIIDYLFEYKRY